MKAFFFLFLIVIFHILLGGNSTTTFTEPINPSQLLVDDQQIYVVDFPFIYIYSTTDYTLKSKIGGEGEGPKQFHYHSGSLVYNKDAFNINIDSEDIVVSSQGKMSYYTKDGIYKKEIRTQHRHDHKFCPIQNKFIGLTARRGTDNIFYLKLNLYNDRLISEKEIFIFERFSQPPNGDINVLYDGGIVFYFYKEKIFVTSIGREDSVIDVFDLKGKKLFSITHEYERPVVTKENKNQYLDYYRAGPLKFIWDRFKKQIKFPTRFPGLRSFSIKNEKIYVLTFKRKNGESEFIIFDVKGKFIKKTMIPLQKKDIYFYPYTIYNGKLYQLVENEDEEKWELQILPFR